MYPQHHNTQITPRKTWFRSFLSHWYKELLILKQNWAVLILAILFNVVHAAAHNLAYYLHIPSEPLYDIGFAILPGLVKELQIISEIAFFIFLSVSISFIISPVFTHNKSILSVAADNLDPETLEDMYIPSNSGTNIITFLSRTLNLSKNFSLSKSFSSFSQRLSRYSFDPAAIGSVGSSEMELGSMAIQANNGKPQHKGPSAAPQLQSMQSFNNNNPRKHNDPAGPYPPPPQVPSLIHGNKSGVYNTRADFNTVDILSDHSVGDNFDTLSDFEGVNDPTVDHVAYNTGMNPNYNTNNNNNNNSNSNNSSTGSHLATLLSTDRAQLATTTNPHQLLFPTLPLTHQLHSTPPLTPHPTTSLNQSYSQHSSAPQSATAPKLVSGNNSPSQQQQQTTTLSGTATLTTRAPSTFKSTTAQLDNNISNSSQNGQHNYPLKNKFDSHDNSPTRNTYEYAYPNDETVQWNTKLTGTTPPLYGVQILTRLAAVLCLSQSLRTMCFLMTALPGPNYHCRPFTEFYSPPTSWGEILVRSDAFFSCGDLVFSSHTTFMVLFALIYTKYGGMKKLKIAVWIFIVSFCALVLAARKHYTVDVLIACYTVPLLWAVFDIYCPDEIPVELARIELQETADLMQN